MGPALGHDVGLFFCVLDQVVAIVEHAAVRVGVDAAGVLVSGVGMAGLAAS